MKHLIHTCAAPLHCCPFLLHHGTHLVASTVKIKSGTMTTHAACISVAMLDYGLTSMYLNKMIDWSHFAHAHVSWIYEVILRNG